MGTNSTASDSRGRSRGTFAAVVSFSKSAGTIVVAVAAIITAATGLIALEFGGGTLALEGALVDRNDALTASASAERDATAKIVEVVCREESELCSTSFLRNSAEAAIQGAFEVARGLTVASETRNVVGPADLPELLLPTLENRLKLAIVSGINGQLQIKDETVQEAVDNSGYFGADHDYAGRVLTLVGAEVRVKSLVASPDLVEKPKWWRDWLLGGGIAIGFVMIGGVLGHLLWRESRHHQ